MTQTTLLTFVLSSTRIASQVEDFSLVVEDFSSVHKRSNLRHTLTALVRDVSF